MDEITIRKAVRSDAARLDAALRNLAVTLGDPHNTDLATLTAAGFGPDPAFGAVLALDNIGTIVGLAMFSPVFSTVKGGAGVYVSDLWVSEAVRGRGLGPRLIAGVAAEAGRPRFMKLAVYDNSPGARRFYDRMGFVPMAGETIMILDESGLDALKGTT